MGRYVLKIKYGDIELNFNTGDPAFVANQLDEFFEGMFGEKPTESAQEETVVEVAQEVTPEVVAEEPEQPKADEVETPSPSGGASFSDVLTRVSKPLDDSELPLMLFLQRKASNSLFDDFIITAFFLKNVLNQTSFTVKSLNLNLYSAANKLVDFKVLNDAMQCEYVKVVEAKDSNEPTRYAITPLGEGYYNKLADT